MDERGECELCVPESVLSQNDYAIDQLPACGNRLGGPDRDESAPRERRAGTLAFLSTMAIIATGAPAIAQDNYPTRPVKLIVAYPPGGSSDLMARIVAAKFTDLWGQQVLVENKPGAAGAIGTDYAAKQPPDGYSFMIANLGPAAVNPLLSSVPYNIEKDFIAVSQISQGPNVLVVRADAPFQSLKEIIDFGKANPGKLSYGTSGPGSVSHLSSEMLKNITKVQATEIPYKGGVDAVKDLTGGQGAHVVLDFVAE